MTLEKVALDGKFVRLEPLEERHRAAIRPAAQHPEIFSVTTSALGPLYDPYIDNALKRSDGTHDLAFAVLLKAQGAISTSRRRTKSSRSARPGTNPRPGAARSIRNASCS